MTVQHSASASRDELARHGMDRPPRFYAKSELVFAQGELAESVFYVVSGRVKIATIATSGKEAVSAILSGGAFFGEGCLDGQIVRVGSARALVACSIVEVEKEVMLGSLLARPDFASLFMRHLLARNARVEGDLIDQILNSSEKRLARILLLLAHDESGATTHGLIPKISQETLAEMVGTTRSRVSFFLNRFRKRGFIDYDGEMRVYASLFEVLTRD